MFEHTPDGFTLTLGAGFWLIITAIGYWKVFTKAGEAGWKGIIPIVNMYTRYKLVWSVPMFWVAFLLLAVSTITMTQHWPLVSALRGLAGLGFFIINVLSFHKLSKAFGHDVGFTAGLFLFEPIFALVLGFDGSRFTGRNAAE